jgi:uncharacterized repeat protein (TIGR02543 family)
MFNLGESVTISASPSKGYSFSGWYDGSTLASSENPYTFSMPYNNVVYVAKFVENSYDLALSFDNTKGSATGAGTYAYKAPVSLSATAKRRLFLLRMVRWRNLGVIREPLSPFHALQQPFLRSEVHGQPIRCDSELERGGDNPVGTCEVFGAGTYALARA